jgi:hypothetical protein
LTKPRLAADPVAERKKTGEVRPEDDGPKIVLPWNDRLITVFLNRFDAQLSAELDAAIGVGPLGLFNMQNRNMEPHIAAAIMFCERRQNGDRVTYAECAAGLNLGDIIKAVNVYGEAHADDADAAEDEDDEPAPVVEEPGDPKE